MRKVISLIHMSLDGYAAGPNGEMDWIVYDSDIEQAAHALHATTDAAIYGRVTYQMMAGYWPSVLANPERQTQAELNHARWVDTATKIVFSRTLDHADWHNTLLIKDNLVEEMQRIKQQPGKDIWLLGSPSLSQAFMQHNLIDEYRINVNPVILGGGKPYFGQQQTRLGLKLVASKAHQNGVTELRYEPAQH